MSSRLSPQSSRRRKWRGKGRELELVKLLQDHGWNAQRFAMSGQGRNNPDVMALKPTVITVFECKSSQTGVAPVRRLQIEKLSQALDHYSILQGIRLEAVIAAKFPYEPWVFRKLSPRDLEENREAIAAKVEDLKRRLESGSIQESLFRQRLGSVYQETFLRIKPQDPSNWHP